MLFTCDFHKLVAGQAELAPVGAEVLVDEVIAECVVTGWYRRVRGEERVGGNGLAGLIESQARGNQFTASFQVQESGMSLVDDAS